MNERPGMQWPHPIVWVISVGLWALILWVILG
jgi:hypothetical protein